MAAADFWSNRERAQGEVEEVSRLRGLINPMQELQRDIDDFDALQELAAEESDPAARAGAEKARFSSCIGLINPRKQRKLLDFALGAFAIRPE